MWPSVFQCSLSYLQNQINNYKQTTKSTVFVNYDMLYTAVIQFCCSKCSNFLGKSWHIIEQFCDLLSHVLLVTETVCSESGKEHVQKYTELVDILPIFIPTTENRSLSKSSIKGT